MTSPLASRFVITAPFGSTVASAHGTSGATANIMTTSDLTFTVTYPTPYVVATATPVANKTVSIVAVNGCGSSAAKALAISTAMPALATATGTVLTFNTCTNKTITVTPVQGANYVWTVPTGATIVGDSNTNTVVVSFAGVTAATATVTVKAISGCVATNISAVKSIVLASAVCPARFESTSDEELELMVFLTLLLILLM